MVDIDKFLKKCKIKIVNGKKYYYTDITFFYFDGIYKHKKSEGVYIAPVNSNKDQIKFKIELVMFKSFLKTVKFYYEMSEKHYKSEVLTKKELKNLALLKISHISFLFKFAKSDLERYEQSMYTKYVYGTTSIEGNTYTLRETDLTLNEGITVGGKEKREFYEIENYGKLQAYIKSQKTIKFDENLVKKIHAIIMQNIDDDSAGSFRKIDVGIRGASFLPMQAVLVEEEIKNLFEWFDENTEKIQELELITIFHQKFEEIHPFKDGNGRVGRELVRIWLYIHGLPTIFIDKTNREEYLKCLDKGNTGNHTPLIRFFYNNLITVHKELLENTKKMLEQEIKDKSTDERYKKMLADKRMQKLIKWLEEE